MPNWTHNTVKFECPKEKIIDLKDKLKSKDNVFDFNRIRPMPNNAKGFEVEGSLTPEDLDGVEGEYMWSMKNWGTKWNSVRSEISDESEVCIEYTFDTAWDAPHPIVKAIFTNGMLKDCTRVEWSCSRDFEDGLDRLIWTNKDKEENE
tara:strand:- start:2061 stop:2504 length:444 start_codon:yes stop_codon:yes gene_type:complete